MEEMIRLFTEILDGIRGMNEMGMRRVNALELCYGAFPKGVTLWGDISLQGEQI